jgi:hypothetical protein
MGSLFSPKAPKPPTPAPPAPMPDAESPEILEAGRKRRLRMGDSGGRASTILTEGSGRDDYNRTTLGG